MKKCLIVSFDLIRKGEVKESLSIASIMSYLKSDNRYRVWFEVEHISFNMYEVANENLLGYFEHKCQSINFGSLTSIAVSCYVWNEHLLRPFIQFVRQQGFIGAVILGGYQISYSSNETLVKDYPFADIYISSYGEQSLLTAVLTEPTGQKVFLKDNMDFSQMPSPYLTGEMTVQQGQQMVRLETKRGCPYRCTFCAHRDLSTNKVHRHPLEKVYEEISWLTQKEVKRINILDPIFNVGKDYNNILREFVRQKSTAEITLQTRFEQISGEAGVEFLNLCEQLNVTLEFGLQTIVEQEYTVINRRNDPKKVEAVMREINNRAIKHEISLIYGLPYQTLDSFRRSIDFAQSMNCRDVKAYPLMLLKGTEMYEERKKWGMQEKNQGEFNIPVVIASDSFTENEWQQMHELAMQLSDSGRIM